MGAFLRYHEKYSLKRRYVIEMTLHEVPDDKRYPLGVKYGFIDIDRLIKDFRSLVYSHLGVKL